jgi:hypothetical protein
MLSRSYCLLGPGNQDPCSYENRNGIVHTEALDQGNIHKGKKSCGSSRSIIEYCRVFRIVNSAVCFTERQGANDYNLGPVGNPS